MSQEARAPTWPMAEAKIRGPQQRVNSAERPKRTNCGKKYITAVPAVVLGACWAPGRVWYMPPGVSSSQTFSFSLPVLSLFL
jgi:hypothetical protein